MDQNDIISTMPSEICDLRQQNKEFFKLLVADCPTREGRGVECDIPECCTFCRRGSG